MIRLFLLAAMTLALATGAATAQGQQALIQRLDAETVDRFAARSSAPMPVADRARLKAAIGAAINFRASMAGEPEALLAALNPDERAILQRLLAEGLGPARAFFRGSIAVVGHARAERPRFGFYKSAGGWLGDPGWRPLGRG
jgi:hypothetical protein